MHTEYDRESDILYIKTASAHPVGAYELGKTGVSFYVSETGEAVGLEVLDASKNEFLRSLKKVKLAV